MPKPKTAFVCRECAYETGKWLGRCPACGEYNTLEETAVAVRTSGPAQSAANSPVKLTEVSSKTAARSPTGMKELDYVLSGGIVNGSLVLIGGDPGIGKSTLLLQICKHAASDDYKILYISGEESAEQIKLRAERLNADIRGVYLLPETDCGAVLAAAEKLRPSLCMVDSIQTMRLADIASTPGSVTQVRECAARFAGMAKQTGAAVILVGHVTKDGAIAGPRVLEHLVDTVLYFETERRDSYRVLRAVKNRFGSTNEIGVFEMRDGGLFGINNPSAHMLAGRPVGVPGSTVVCSVEGSRTILCEIQALCGYTQFGMPRRTVTGLDYNRVTMLIAVLEKRAGYKLQTYDCYVNAAGGIRIDEPAADAGVIAALASCYKNKPIDSGAAVFGEVGLTGELRAVSHAEKRVEEAFRQGFKTCVLPRANLKAKTYRDIQVYGASNIGEMLEILI